MNKLPLILLTLVLVAASCNRTVVQPTTPDTNSPELPISEPAHKPVEFAAISPTFKFTGKIPTDWQVEYIVATDALNIYNPLSDAESNLEKSQIFIRNFTANSFLTLSTVDILSRVETTVGERPAVKYEIKKKPGIADFPNQPSWRNQQHKLIDIRLSKANPSLFYVFAYNPDLDPEVFNQFISTLTF